MQSETKHIYRLLVAEDDRNVRLALTEALRRSGFQVESAANGYEAILVHQRNPVDVAIIDLLMPEKDGIETIQDLGKTNVPPKCIAISAGGRLDAEVYLSVAIQLGARKILVKPFDLSQILQAIHEVLAPEEDSESGVDQESNIIELKLATH